MNLNVKTTAAGHGNHVHDAFIWFTRTKTRDKFKQNLIRARPGTGVSCRWVKSELGGNMQKQFIEVPVKDVRVANSPISRM